MKIFQAGHYRSSQACMAGCVKRNHKQRRQRGESTTGSHQPTAATRHRVYDDQPDRRKSKHAMSDCSSHDQPTDPAFDIGIPRHNGFDGAAFERAVGDLLSACGIAPDDAHMARTPQRVRELWQRRLLGGYDLDPAAALGDGFADQRSDLVVVRGIAVHGVCPHHLVPFRGLAHVAYLPGGRLHGFGRIARLVDAIGHRFTYQEWMTRDIADALMVHGKARGAACVIEAEQLCLLLGEDRRGDERVITQSFSGEFERSAQLRNEFLRATGGRRGD
jgi:GTP cyclohydrolase I